MILSPLPDVTFDASVIRLLSLRCYGYFQVEIFLPPTLQYARRKYNSCIEGDGLSMKDVSEKLPEVLTPNESESTMSNE